MICFHPTALSKCSDSEIRTTYWVPKCKSFMSSSSTQELAVKADLLWFHEGPGD